MPSARERRRGRRTRQALARSNHGASTPASSGPADAGFCAEEFNFVPGREGGVQRVGAKPDTTGAGRSARFIGSGVCSEGDQAKAASGQLSRSAKLSRNCRGRGKPGPRLAIPNAVISPNLVIREVFVMVQEQRDLQVMRQPLDSGADRGDGLPCPERDIGRWDPR